MQTGSIHEQGFQLFAPLFSPLELQEVANALAASGAKRSRAGIRHALKVEAVSKIAHDARLLGIAKTALGGAAVPYHATLFEKSPDANWLVVWHQDTALPLRDRKDATGWGPWSIKEGVHFAHAPASALSTVLALRVHLDDSTAENGPLRVLPATHTRGVLSDDTLHELSEKIAPVDCIAPKGGVVAMRPLLAHASSKSRNQAPRRVLHIEYAASLHLDGGLELAIA